MNATMTELIILLGLLFGLGGVIIYIRHIDRQTGQDQKELEQSKEVINNVKKANSVKYDDTYDDELRDKYGRK